jgi:hypothetical protein
MTKWLMWGSLGFGLLVALAGCGVDKPDVVEATSSPLTSAQVFQGTGIFGGYTYNCGGAAWTLKQTIGQAFSQQIHFGNTTLSPGGPNAVLGFNSKDPSRNEILFTCPASTMLDRGSFLGNQASLTCGAYAHPAGGDWEWSETVRFAANNFRYAPVGTFGYPYGYWDLEMTTAANLGELGTSYGLGCFHLGFGATVELYAF